MNANELERAKSAYAESAGIFERLGRRHDAANASAGVGFVLLVQGQHDEAEELLRTLLNEAVDVGSSPLAAEIIGTLGIARLERDPAAGVRLLAAAARLLHELGLAYHPGEQKLVDEAERKARETLGERFEAEWEAGSELSLDDAVALALGEA